MATVILDLPGANQHEALLWLQTNLQQSAQMAMRHAADADSNPTLTAKFRKEYKADMQAKAKERADASLGLVAAIYGPCHHRKFLTIQRAPDTKTYWKQASSSWVDIGECDKFTSVDDAKGLLDAMPYMHQFFKNAVFQWFIVGALTDPQNQSPVLP